MTSTALRQAPATYSLPRKFVRSLRTRGVAGTLRVLSAYAVQAFRHNLTWNPYNPLRQYLDRRYDAKYGVDTAGIDFIPEGDLDLANAYSPVPQTKLVPLLRRLCVDQSQFVFIDIGCGKGKALLVASELPFKAVIGVESVERLATIARENLRTLRLQRRTPPYEVFALDAREFRFPDEPLVIFMYDPFRAPVMEKVIANVRESYERTPRPMYIIYSDPTAREFLDGAGFLKPVWDSANNCIYASSQAREMQSIP